MLRRDYVLELYALPLPAGATPEPIDLTGVFSG